MSYPANLQYSPYRVFTREEWARLRADTPMTLEESELEQLSGLIEELSVEEVEQIYLPMSRLLNLYVAAAQQLHSVTSKFLGRTDGKVPFIIGVGGSVAVGKSTTARVLKALLARWPDHPRVDQITTDGFLLPNAELEQRKLMDRKGFPESFDTARLLNFLADVKSGDGERGGAGLLALPLRHPARPTHRRRVCPTSSSSRVSTCCSPRACRAAAKRIPFVSDFFDFSIYLDAEPEIIEDWYVARFMRLRTTAFRDPAAYFHQYANLSPEAGARARARDLAHDQLEEPRGEHSPDAAARAPDPA